MRSFNSAQAGNLVCIYLINGLSRFIPEIDSGLYREVLFIIRRPNANQLDIDKKKLHVFSSYGLQITIDKKKHTTVNYLDYNLNLLSGTLKNYHENNENEKQISALGKHLSSTKNVLVNKNYKISSSL